MEAQQSTGQFSESDSALPNVLLQELYRYTTWVHCVLLIKQNENCQANVAALFKYVHSVALISLVPVKAVIH